MSKLINIRNENDFKLYVCSEKVRNYRNDRRYGRVL